VIRGVGIDIVDVGRVASLLARHGERFLRRVFTDGEVGYCTGKHDPSPHLAARFAAKEAAAKAFGIGIASGVRLKDIEVCTEGGPPRLRLHNRASVLAQDLGVTGIHLSLSHERAFAVAIVLLEGDG
jgi:holo-[acyl-carrier protein] synthase